jgi:hypothetical protein
VTLVLLSNDPRLGENGLGLAEWDAFGIFGQGLLRFAKQPRS